MGLVKQNDVKELIKEWLFSKQPVKSDFGYMLCSQ